jgi:hypothetical protein
VSDSEFEISYDPALRVLFTLLGLGPGLSTIRVSAESVRIRMGWAFWAKIPRSAIASLAPDDGLVGGWGVHGWGGRWLVNGSSEDLVRFEISPSARAFVLAIPVRLRRLRLSVADRDHFLRLLGGQETTPGPARGRRFNRPATPRPRPPRQP